jgi:hypothetical protein
MGVPISFRAYLVQVHPYPPVASIALPKITCYSVHVPPVVSIADELLQSIMRTVPY